MDKKLLEDSAKKYLKGDDLSTAIGAINGLSGPELIKMISNNRGYAFKMPAILKGSVSMYSYSDENALCDVTVRNIGDAATEFAAEINVGGEMSVRKYRIDADQTVNEKIVLDDVPDSLTSAECAVRIIDSRNKEIASASSVIEFNIVKEDPLTSTVDIPETIDVSSKNAVTVAVLTIESHDKNCNQCKVSVKCNGSEATELSMQIHPMETVKRIVTLQPECFGDDSARISVTVSANGKDILSADKNVKIEGLKKSADIRPAPSDIVVSYTMFADVALQKIVDTHSSKDGNLVIGKIAIASSVKSELATITVSMDGEVITVKNLPIKSKSQEIYPIIVPTVRVSREDTFASDIAVTVKDSQNNLVFTGIFTVRFLAKYDVNLKNLKGRMAAEMTNPLSPAVKSFIDKKDGPLGKKMPENVSVSGYNGNYIEQLKAVYEAVKDLGMTYVSDTVCFEGNYQRIRTVDKVLSDHSGNCIELSLMFASIFEAMGFEPVIIYPHGHAIVGVVVATDRYESESCPPEKERYEYMIAFKDADGRSSAIIPIESTLCKSKETQFETAVKSAVRSFNEEHEMILEEDNFSFIAEQRLNGTKPRVEMFQ